MSTLSRARFASATILALTCTALTAGASPVSAADPTATFQRNQPITFRDGPIEFENSDDISVPGAGAATPYPSQVDVEETGVVTDVNVNITFAHDRPDDLDLMLVGPQGQAVVVMSDAGGSEFTSTFGIRLDDEGDAPLPDEENIDEQFTSFFLPANYGSGADAFPAPAPTPTTSSPALGAFDGTSPTGTWSLYVADDEAGAAGVIDSWRLDLQTAAPGTYPSTLPISGIGTVADVDVTLRGFTTEYAADIAFLLEGPQGQRTVLLNESGGGSSESVDEPIDIRFDDEAPFEAPEDDALEATSYQPTDHDDDLPLGQFPWPAAPIGQGYPTTLSVFDGTDPSGTWRLYGYDDAGGDVSTIQGWSLHIRWSDPSQPGGSIVVAGGAARTGTSTVALSLSATDPAPGTGVTHMRLSNDGATYAPWVPFAATTTWALAGGHGTRTVFAQFRDGAGNVSDAVRDTIVLDTKAPRAKKTRPGDGERSVRPGATIKVVASEALAGPTVRAATVKLFRGAERVAAKVGYDASDRRILVDPKADLAPGDYRLKVTTRVTDVVGNRWDQSTKGGRQPLVVIFRV